MVGFAICCFSFVMAILLVWIDWWAARKDNIQVTLTEEDKFKFRDLREFDKLPFWLVTGSCVIIYMVVFPYIQVSTDMM